MRQAGYAGSGDALTATFTAIRNKKQPASVLHNVIEYVEQEKKRAGAMLT